MGENLPIETAGPARPPRVYPHLNRRLRLAMWLALIGGPVMLAVGAYEYLERARLQREGVAVAGELVDSSIVSTSKGRTTYRVTLQYPVKDAGMSFRKDFDVPHDAFERIQADRTAQVKYMPGSPMDSVIGEHVPIDPEPLAAGGGLLLFGGAVWLYRRRQNRAIDQYLAGAKSAGK